MLNYKENPLVVEKREHLNFADAPGVGLVFPESKVGRGPSWHSSWALMITPSGGAFPEGVTNRGERVIFMKMLTAAQSKNGNYGEGTTADIM